MSRIRLHVVLYQPEIPQNTGNIGRTCVAVGAKLWIVRPTGFQLDNRHLERAGLDYWQYLLWEAVDTWNDLLAAIPSKRFWFYTRHATRKFTDVDYAQGDALVFGSESQGLPTSVCPLEATNRVRIPTDPRVRSLNLATTVGIACFHATNYFDPDDGFIGS